MVLFTYSALLLTFWVAERMLKLLSIIMSLSFPIFFLDGLLFVYLRAMLWGLYTFNISMSFSHFISSWRIHHNMFWSYLFLLPTPIPSWLKCVFLFGFFFKPINPTFAVHMLLDMWPATGTDLPRTTLFNRTDSPSAYQLPMAFQPRPGLAVLRPTPHWDLV